MSEIRDELVGLIFLNEIGQWVPNHIALQQLEHLGNDLIPGLIDCLTDEDTDVRKLAVELLCEARPRSNIAVPALIERLTDEDRLVRIAVMTHIADFGRIAVAAIPYLEPWLEVEPWSDDEDEYLRVVALTAIMTLDPDRTNLLPLIHEALRNDNPMVRETAREFFGKMKLEMPFDESAFKEVVRSSWLYYTACEEVEWSSKLEEGTYECDVSPVLQELWGGESDGLQVWSGFQFHLSGFFHEPGIEIEDFGTMSQSEVHSTTPQIWLRGVYFGQKFLLRIHLQPLPDCEVREVFDTFRNQVREIEDKEEE